MTIMNEQTPEEKKIEELEKEVKELKEAGEKNEYKDLYEKISDLINKKLGMVDFTVLDNEASPEERLEYLTSSYESRDIANLKYQEFLHNQIDREKEKHLIFVTKLENHIVEQAFTSCCCFFGFITKPARQKILKGLLDFIEKIK